ncbi:MAG: hypothetical protein JSS43_19390 [Proteobacteria bacterium]|nr:hypothetical protein [Pseudomonadota bacterium]
MAILTAIAEWSLLAFGALLLLVQLAAHEVGHWIGYRQRPKAAGRAESAALVVGGILGLLAFVLALTLSFASNRFNERRAGTLAEANAIGTAWLRAEAIGQPRGNEIARLLEQYTQVRLDFVRTGDDPDRLAALNQQTNTLQSAIWGHAAALVREQPGPVSTWLASSINDAFDAGTEERFGFAFRLPSQIVWLVVGLVILGVGAIGYQLGLKGGTVRPMILLLTAVWTVVIVDILDLAAGRLGRFRTDPIAYEWTLRGFKGGVTIPPPPARQ